MQIPSRNEFRRVKQKRPCGVSCLSLSEVSMKDHPITIIHLYNVIPAIGSGSCGALCYEVDRDIHCAIGKLRGTRNGESVLYGVGKATGELRLRLRIVQPEVISTLIIFIVDVGVICLYGNLR